MRQLGNTRMGSAVLCEIRAVLSVTAESLGTMCAHATFVSRAAALQLPAAHCRSSKGPNKGWRVRKRPKPCAIARVRESYHLQPCGCVMVY